jgi:hypothetical protein
MDHMSKIYTLFLYSTGTCKWNQLVDTNHFPLNGQKLELGSNYVVPNHGCLIQKQGRYWCEIFFFFASRYFTSKYQGSEPQLQFWLKIYNYWIEEYPACFGVRLPGDTEGLKREKKKERKKQGYICHSDLYQSW